MTKAHSWQRRSARLLAIVLATASAHAQSAAPPATPKPLTDLADVVVSGEKPTREPSELIAWLRRLVGPYTYDGYIELTGADGTVDRRAARGSGLCVGFGVAPGVQCEINVRWPEVQGQDTDEMLSGISALTPAMILYGMEPDDLGIRYLQVNSKGVAEGATGYVIGDMATFKTPCVNTPPGCQRAIRITAKSGSSVIDMQIDTELNYQVAARFRFQMRRLPPVQREKSPGAKR